MSKKSKQIFVVLSARPYKKESSEGAIAHLCK